MIRVKQFFICKNLVFGPHFGQKSYKIVLIIRTFPFRNTLKSHVFKSYVVVRKRAPWLAGYHVCKNRFTSNSKPQQRSSLPSFIVCSALASTIQLENLSQWSYRGWKRVFLVKMLDPLDQKNGMKELLKFHCNKVERAYKKITTGMKTERDVSVLYQPVQ